jgi:hypothetical protein
VVLGYYGGRSFAAYAEDGRDLYLERAYELGANGWFDHEVDGNRGVWINADNAVSVEFYTPNGDDRNTQNSASASASTRARRGEGTWRRPGGWTRRHLRHLRQRRDLTDADEDKPVHGEKAHRAPARRLRVTGPLVLRKAQASQDVCAAAAATSAASVPTTSGGQRELARASASDLEPKAWMIALAVLQHGVEWLVA